MDVEACHLALADSILTKIRLGQLATFDVDKLHLHLVGGLKAQHLQVGGVAAVNTGRSIILLSLGIWERNRLLILLECVPGVSILILSNFNNFGLDSLVAAG